MATIGGDWTKEIISEMNRFGSIMQQNIIENEFNHKYSPLATIQPGAAIEFTVKCSSDLYLDLNNLSLNVLAQKSRADRLNINTDSRSNQPDASHDIPRDCRGVKRSKCRQHEPAVLLLIIPEMFVQLLQADPRDSTLCKVWTKDKTGKMGVIAVVRNNAGMNAWAATFAKSTVFDLIGRPHKDVFHQDRLNCLGIDLHKK